MSSLPPANQLKPYLEHEAATVDFEKQKEIASELQQIIEEAPFDKFELEIEFPFMKRGPDYRKPYDEVFRHLRACGFEFEGPTVIDNRMASRHYTLKIIIRNPICFPRTSANPLPNNPFPQGFIAENLYFSMKDKIEAGKKYVDDQITPEKLRAAAATKDREFKLLLERTSTLPKNWIIAGAKWVKRELDSKGYHCELKYCDESNFSVGYANGLKWATGCGGYQSWLIIKV